MTGDFDLKGKATTLIKNDGFVSGKDGWSLPVAIDAKHRSIIDDIIELQKDSDLYQEKIATLDKENQDLFSANMKLASDNEELRKVLSGCKIALSYAYHTCALDLYDRALIDIEQTLSKGKTE